MDEYESLSHSQWECKYHVIFSQMPAQSVVSGPAAAFGRSAEALGRAEAEPG